MYLVSWEFNYGKEAKVIVDALKNGKCAMFQIMSFQINKVVKKKVFNGHHFKTTITTY